MENKQKSVADFLENLFSNLDNKGLTSLEGSPKQVEVFDVSRNNLKNLIGGPQKVKRYFAYSNKLESLEGSPYEVDYFNISGNNLKNLVGGPKKVKEHYFVSFNKLESLEGSPEEVSYFDISYNPTLRNTDGIPRKIGKLYVDGTIRSVSQFTKYPECVGEIIFDSTVPIEDVKKIISNIKEVQYVHVGDKKYTRDEILKTNK
jgi:hypothetical protein